MTRLPKLVEALDETIDFLRSYHEDSWADWLAADRERLLAGDREALDHILLAFGGMGSLNDLAIDPRNGHPIRPDQVQEENERLVRLLNRIHNRAWFARCRLRMVARGRRLARWLGAG